MDIDTADAFWPDELVQEVRICRARWGGWAVTFSTEIEVEGQQYPRTVSHEAYFSAYHEAVEWAKRPLGLVQSAAISKARGES